MLNLKLNPKRKTRRLMGNDGYKNEIHSPEHSGGSGGLYNEGDVNLYNKNSPEQHVIPDVLETSNNSDYGAEQFVLSKNAFNMEYDIDIDTRTIFITGEILDTTLVDIIMRVKMIFNMTQDYDSDINIMIDSWGGDVYSILVLLDDFRSIQPCKVNTIARGRAFSAAAILLCAATGKRMASKYCSIMFHEISSEMYGKTSEMKMNMKELEYLNNTFIEILHDATNRKDKDFWKTTLERDFYITSSEALELGIIDSII